MAIRNRYDEGIKDLSDDYGELLVKTLRGNLRELGKHASGSLIDSIFHEVRTDGDKSVILLKANDYLGIVDKGRKPGTFPNMAALSRWATVKGISQRAVYPIAKKISERGITKTNVISISINEVQRIFLPSFEKEMAKLVGVILVNDIFNKTNTLGQMIPKNLR